MQVFEIIDPQKVRQKGSVLRQISVGGAPPSLLFALAFPEREFPQLMAGAASFDPGASKEHQQQWREPLKADRYSLI